MRVFFEDIDTGKSLFIIEDASVIPDVGESIMFNNIWYVVINRTFYYKNIYSCTIWIKKDM